MNQLQVMKAIVFRGKDYPLQLASVPRPAVTKGKILVRLKYAALNHLDLLIIKRTTDVPTGQVILGADGAGVVEEVGNDIITFRPGDEVVINPALHWGNDKKAPGPEFEILGF